MNPFFLVVLAYLAGATPTSFWVGRVFYGIDLRRRGSGNLGATNTFRVLGWRAALPVVVFDMGKGFVPVWAFPSMDAAGTPAGWMLAYGAAAIAGHVFSVWVRFRGGKGVATSAGVFLALAPWAVLVAFAVWLATVLATRIVSLASLLAALATPLAVWLTPHEGGAEVLAFAGVLAVFVVWAHRSNIERLARGEENRFGTSSGGGADEAGGGPPGRIPHADGGTSEEVV